MAAETNGLVDEVLMVLADQEAVCRELLAVLKKEHHALTRLGLDQVNEATHEKETLISKMNILEDQRKKVVQRLSSSLGCTSNTDELTLKKLVPLLQEPHLTRIKTCRSNILDVIKSIQDANGRNQALLTYSVGLVNSTLALLNNLASRDTVYYCNGKVQAGDHNGRVISGDI